MLKIKWLTGYFDSISKAAQLVLLFNKITRIYRFQFHYSHSLLHYYSFFLICLALDCPHFPFRIYLFVRHSKIDIQKLSVREFSCHELNANLLWPGTFSFATWLVKNQSILDGRRVLELGRYGCYALTLTASFLSFIPDQFNPSSHFIYTTTPVIALLGSISNLGYRYIHLSGFSSLLLPLTWGMWCVFYHAV